MNIIKQILTYAILASSVLHASAQEDGTEKKKGKTYRATLFNKWKGAPLFTKHKKDYIPIKPAKYSYTRLFSYKEQAIELYKKGVSEEGEEIYIPALKVNVPTTILEPLLILAWDMNKQKPTAKVIEFSPKKFPYGSYQIVNFSALPLEGYIGAKSNGIRCMPSKTYITRFAFKAHKATPIVFYARINNELKKVFGSITMHKPTKRAVYLMFPQKNKLGRFLIQSSVIVDFERKQN